VTVQTFAPCVQDLQQEIHHSVVHFANFVQTFVMLVLLNVKNFQHTIVVKSVPKLAENVLLSAAKCNQLFFPIAESPLRDFAQGKNKKLNNGQTFILGWLIGACIAVIYNVSFNKKL
jgi:hypothetical protein